MDVLAQSKAAAKRGVMTVLRPRLETSSAAKQAQQLMTNFFLFYFFLSFTHKSSPSPVLHALLHIDGHGSSKHWRH